MTIMQMECFVEAARCGSFTKAGENLYISQQTMSRHIRALETELGFPLFERKNTGAVLTRAGSVCSRTGANCCGCTGRPLTRRRIFIMGSRKSCGSAFWIISGSISMN